MKIIFGYLLLFEIYFEKKKKFFNLSKNMDTFAAGCFGGFVGITLSHPVDTIKTFKQSNSIHLLNFKHLSVAVLYKGYFPPLCGMMLEKSVLFWGFSQVQKNTNLGIFNSGLIAGLLTTAIVTPFERVKIRAQTTQTSSANTIKQIIKSDGLTSLYRGWTATLFREVPGYGIYFTVFQHAKPKLENFLNKVDSVAFSNKSPSKKTCEYLSVAVAGSLSGVSAWTVIYPSDPIKTIAQNENISSLAAVKKIYESAGIKGFYKGFTPAIIRASILHGGVFIGYYLYLFTFLPFFDKSKN